MKYINTLLFSLTISLTGCTSKQFNEFLYGHDPESEIREYQFKVDEMVATGELSRYEAELLMLKKREIVYQNNHGSTALNVR